MNLNVLPAFLITCLLQMIASDSAGQPAAVPYGKITCQMEKQAVYATSALQPVTTSALSAMRSDTVDILNHTLDLNITDFSGKTIRGSCAMTFVSKMDSVAALSLDLLAMNIDSITSAGGNLSYAYNDTLLRIQLPATLDQGDSGMVTVYYNGSPVIDPSGWGGFYWQGNYAYNLGVGFESIPHNYGRVWFPCFDNFVERSTYTFNITTAGGRNAKCNGAYLGADSLGGDTIVNHWKLDETIPSYLACVAVAPYQTVNMTYNGMNGPVPIELYAVAGDTANVRASFANTGNALAAFEQGYGPYRWNKAGYSMVPFNSGAMEHATNITYPRYAADGSLYYQDLMAHELSHMWWGDLATCETAGDMWLNEGMASFSEFLFAEYLDGPEAYRQLVRDNHEYVVHMAHVTEGGYLAISGIPLEITYGDHVYLKGADVAHTLRGYMGDSLFFGGLTAFLDDHEFTHMNSYMLRDYLSSYSGIDLSDFFDKWVFKGGFPHFSIDSVAATPSGPDYEATVYVKQKLLAAYHYYTNVPLEITFFSAGWTAYTETMQVSGPLSNTTFTLPFDPVFTAINYDNKISDAVSSDVKIIKTPGQYNFVNNASAHMTLIVSSVTDSALIRIEHNWTYPDPIGGITKYKLCPNRYWKVDGIMPAAYSMNVKVFYDGKESGSSYYDHDLFSTPADHEDSLVVMYRRDAGESWNEWPFYTKNVIAANDEWGQIILDSLVLGEYVFALKTTTFRGSTHIAGVTHISCKGACDGSVSVSAGGGAGPYSFLWDDPAVQTGNTASGLCAGDFHVTVSDAGGDTLVLSATVSELDGLGGAATVTNASCPGCSDGIIAFSATGGATPYTYQWNDLNNQTGSTATGLSGSGDYTLTLSDANGCTFTLANLAVSREDITLPKGELRLSPNPASGSFRISSLKEPFFEKAVLEVTDINGKSIVRERLPAGDREFNVRPANWKPGIYLITIRDRERVQYTEKLVYTKE